MVAVDPPDATPIITVRSHAGNGATTMQGDLGQLSGMVIGDGRGSGRA
jgi:hypothetical protein